MNDALFEVILEYIVNTKTTKSPTQHATLILLLTLTICAGSLSLEVIPMHLQKNNSDDPTILVENRGYADIVLSFDYDPILNSNALWFEFLEGAVSEAKAQHIGLRLRSGSWDDYDNRINQALTNNSQGLILNTLDGLSQDTILRLNNYENITIADNNQTQFKSVLVDDFNLGVLVTKDLKKLQPAITNAIILEGIPNTKNNKQRVDGLKSGLHQAGIPVKATISAWWRRIDAQQRAIEIINNYPQVNLIVCANDEMALGVLDALDLTHTQRRIYITGFDLVGDMPDLIRQGQILASIDTQARLRGKIAVRLSLKSGKQTIKLKPLTQSAISTLVIDDYLDLRESVNLEISN